MPDSKPSSRQVRADTDQVHFAHVRNALWSPLCTDEQGWVAPLARYVAQVTCASCRARMEAPDA